MVVGIGFLAGGVLGDGVVLDTAPSHFLGVYRAESAAPSNQVIFPVQVVGKDDMALLVI